MITQEAKEHELNFWKQFITSDRFLNDWLSNEKTTELDDDVASFILSQPHEKVIDAGSGVVSILHGLIPDANIYATDPLGNDYATIFDYASKGLTPPVSVAAEDIMNSGIDIAHIRNAIDHTQNPSRAYESLYNCLKPGGFLIVQGFTREADHENWKGFHQWNFYIEDERLMCDGRDGHLFGIYRSYSHKTIKLSTGREWFVFIIQKGAHD